MLMYLTYRWFLFINAIHSSMEMTTKEASRKENENNVWNNLYPKQGGKKMTPKVSISDNVRITKKKKKLIRDTLKDGWKRFLQFLKCN